MKQQKKLLYVPKKKMTADDRKNLWALGLAGVGLGLHIAAAIIYGVGLPEKKKSDAAKKRRIRKKKEAERKIKCPYPRYANYLLETGKKEY